MWSQNTAPALVLSKDEFGGLTAIASSLQVSKAVHRKCARSSGDLSSTAFSWPSCGSKSDCRPKVTKWVSRLSRDLHLALSGLALFPMVKSFKSKCKAIPWLLDWEDSNYKTGASLSFGKQKLISICVQAVSRNQWKNTVRLWVLYKSEDHTFLQTKLELTKLFFHSKLTLVTQKIKSVAEGGRWVS